MTFVLAGCSNKISEPEDIGPQVIDILADLDDESRQEFAKHFISIKKIHALANDRTSSLDESRRREFLFTSASDLKTRYALMRKGLKIEGERLGVTWSDISKEGFNKRLREYGGTNYVHGELRFRSNGLRFSVSTLSLFDGEEYLLIAIGNLRRLKSL